MASADTSDLARRQLMSVFASMTGSEKVLYAADMADEVRTIALAGIRSRHPEMSDREVAIEWVRLLHGDEIADIAKCSSSF